MLTISVQALRALEHASRSSFLAGLREELAEKYPHFLPRFPDTIQAVIVSNMVGRAGLWGLDRQNAIACYCGWMIEIAGNFDQEPDIAHLLGSLDPVSLNAAIFDLPDHVSELAWSRAERGASNLPFFIGPDLAHGTPDQQTLAAIPIALAGRPEAQKPAAVMAQAATVAQALGIDHIADAALVTTACLSHFGPGFTQQAWLVELRQRRLQPGAFVEALRLRLALNFGCFI